MLSFIVHVGAKFKTFPLVRMENYLQFTLLTLPFMHLCLILPSQLQTKIALLNNFFGTYSRA